MLHSGVGCTVFFVNFVVDDDESFSLCASCNVGDFSIVGDGIDEPKDDLCFVDGCVGALDSDLFHSVLRLANASGVDEAESNTADIDGVFNRVASGAVDVGNNRTIVVEESIEKSGFAYVGFAYDGDRNTIFNRIARSEGVDQFCDGMIDGLCQLEELLQRTEVMWKYTA